MPMVSPGEISSKLKLCHAPKVSRRLGEVCVLGVYCACRLVGGS